MHDVFPFYQIGHFINQPNNPTEFELTRFGTMAEPEIDDPHKHTFYEIIWVEAGTSEQVIDYKTYAIVIGTFRQEKQVTAFNNAHKNKGMAYRLDVTDEAQIDETVRRVTADFGRLDVLVNNAGVGFAGAIEEAAMTEVRAVFETNFFGALKITQAFLPLFRQQRRGHIVQISSHGGLKAFAGFGIYNASKFALEGISEALAQELAPLGIKLAIVEPGPFRTKFAHDGFVLAKTVLPDYAETAGTFRTRIKAVDGKQEGDPAKAAEAICALTGMENPPLRLPLGKTALVTIGMKLESVAADLEQSRAIAEGAVY